MGKRRHRASNNLCLIDHHSSKDNATQSQSYPDVFQLLSDFMSKVFIYFVNIAKGVRSSIHKYNTSTRDTATQHTQSYPDVIQLIYDFMSWVFNGIRHFAKDVHLSIDKYIHSSRDITIKSPSHPDILQLASDFMSKVFSFLQHIAKGIESIIVQELMSSHIVLLLISAWAIYLLLPVKTNKEELEQMKYVLDVFNNEVKHAESGLLSKSQEVCGVMHYALNCGDNLDFDASSCKNMLSTRKCCSEPNMKNCCNQDTTTCH